jgi:formate dehydrogenase major subunit
LEIFQKRIIMQVDRRSFLTSSGAAAFLAFLGLDISGTKAYAATADVKRGTLTTTICPYCGVGCGLVVTASGGKVVNIEGDPDHPVNLGALCSKGAALYQVANNDRRLDKVLYRAPNSSSWEVKDWDWALKKIAANIKATRDETFVAVDDQGRTVNRTEGIACIGGAALDNEECYAYSKLSRAMGVVYIEHQARI